MKHDRTLHGGIDHLHATEVDAFADPQLRRIARGLGLLLETGEDDDLPDELHDLTVQLTLGDDGDGPDRED